MLDVSSPVTINTGNVLNLIDLKNKAGQNVTEELSQSIKLTLSEWKSQESSAKVVTNGYHHDSPTNNTEAIEATLITRPTDDVKNKMAEDERKNFMIGVKIFINEPSVESLTDCLENVFSALNTDSIENVILAYNPPPVEALPQTTSSVINKADSTVQIETRQIPDTGSSLVKMSSTEVDADSEADALKCEQLLPGLKVLWQVLEEYVKKGRVSQLGVADTGGGCLRKLYAWARVRPSIAQINLASCCVVPPSLHAFCKANHVQLLTHADPPDLLTEATTKAFTDSELSQQSLRWCARYQMHIKCRGVLVLKGYVCRAARAGGE